MRTLCGFLVLCVALTSWGQTEWQVFSSDEDGSVMVERHLSRLRDEAFAARALRYEARTELADIAEYQREMKRFFRKQLGEWPGDVNPGIARVVNEYVRDGFTVETLLIKTAPDYYVTATMFLPDESVPRPYPAVLVPCGHSATGKAIDVYQRACILLARNGIAALIYDPLDQGERYQILNDEGRPVVGNTDGHTMLGVGSILLGRNTATFRVFDGLCMIEYLKQRSDVDETRIGCTGNSGGGTLTSYLMALSDDIVCAVPSCYLTTLQHQDPQDAEQNIFGQVAFGMDHADYVMMRAPRPTLMCAATHDFFAIEGTWKAFREAKRLYTRLGFGERVSMIETDASHGFSIQLREGMVRWMTRWLYDKDVAISEPYFQVMLDEEVQVTPSGQLYARDAKTRELFNGAMPRTAYDLNREYEADLYRERRQQFATRSLGDLKNDVRGLTATREMEALAPVGDPEARGVDEMDGFSVHKLAFAVEEDLHLPALLFAPAEASGDPILYLHGEGKTTDAQMSGRIRALVAEGHPVYSVDMRNCGELAPEGNHAGHVRRFGPGWQNYYLAYWMGKSFVGIRVEDTLRLARWIEEEHGSAPRLVAVGELGIPALHAVFLEPDRFASVTIREMIPAWSNVIDADLTQNQLINTVHGALRTYDLPDLIERIPDGKLRIENPVDVMGVPL